MKIYDMVNRSQQITALQNKSSNLAIKNMNYIIDSLFPSSNGSLFDGINSFFPRYGNKISNFISDIVRVQDTFLQQGMLHIKGQSRATNEYERYLQVNDPKIKKLAMSIVDVSDSNDDKVYKIEQWVINEIPYEFDSVNYGVDEYWSTPTETLRKGSGDCEDQSFLIHSLALNAGIDPERLRTYGGVVAWQNDAGGLSAGGHAWTAYQREEDNKWIIADATFFTTDKPFDERIGMEDNFKYVDDYFFVNYKNTVDTPYTNGIRKPNIHKGYPDTRFTGNIINMYL